MQAAAREEALAEWRAADRAFASEIRLSVDEAVVGRAPPVRGTAPSPRAVKQHVPSARSKKLHEELMQRTADLDALGGRLDSTHVETPAHEADAQERASIHPAHIVARKRAAEASTLLGPVRAAIAIATRRLEAAQRAFLHACAHGLDLDLDDDRTEDGGGLCDPKRIRSACGPFDVLMLPRDDALTDADVAHRAKRMQKEVHPDRRHARSSDAVDADEGVSSQLVNEAAGAIATCALRRAFNATTPIATVSTAHQRRRAAAADATAAARVSTLETAVAALLAPLVAAVPPMGLHTSMVPTDRRNEILKATPAFGLLRHADLRVEAVRMAAYHELFYVPDDVREAGWAPTFHHPVYPVEVVCSVRGVSFRVPMELFGVRTCAREPTLELKTAAARVLTLVRHEMERLDDTLLDACMQRLGVAPVEPDAVDAAEVSGSTRRVRLRKHEPEVAKHMKKAPHLVATYRVWASEAHRYETDAPSLPGPAGPERSDVLALQ